MKFVIAGLGSIGRRHLRNLVALGERDIVLFRTHRSTLPDDDLSNFPVETDLNEALSQNPEAVIVSNPTALHLDVAIPAAQAGCHLLLEKPISHTMERIDELKDAVAAGGGQVLVGFQFRFHPGLVKCAQLLGDGAIGRPLSVRAVYGEYLPSMHPWEDYRGSFSARHDLGGGAVLTLCHPLDYLRWLLGEVQDLWAFADRLNDFKMQVDDTAEVGLRFTSGVLGSVNMNYNQRPRAQNLEIVGTTGTLRWDNDTGRLSVFEVSASSVSSAANGEWVTFPVPDGFDRNDMFLAEMEHFLAVVRGEAQPVCTLEDGVKALELALAIHESGRSRELIRI